jgi:hypothetical protein
MRSCVKLRCENEAVATVALRYADRTVWLHDLLPQRDPNLLDLCRGHADALRPPLGWQTIDERSPVGTVETLAHAERYPA